MEKYLELLHKTTESRFSEVTSKIDRIENRLDDLVKFKIEMLNSSKWVSFLISGAFGLITTALSVLITFYMKGK